MGIVSSIGHNVDAMWDALVQGRSGVRRVEGLNAEQYPTRIAGYIADFRPEDTIDPREARRMARFSQFAVVASRAALADADYRPDGEALRAGVLLGNGIGGLDEVERGMRTLVARGGMRVPPAMIMMIISNMAAFHVAHTFGLLGYNNTVVTACAAGTQSIGEAYEAIRRGQADVLVCGGAEAALCELSLAAFSVNHAYSRRNDDPARASRPFDRDRDGFVPSEGAGILVLERLSHALDRGARIHAEVLGYGTSTDAYHVVTPEPTGAGAARAMTWALEAAGLAAADVDYINAHGTSTLAGDVAETRAVKAALGRHAYRIPMSATKSMTGHPMGAAGGIEAIATIKTIQTGCIHPTINLDHPDPECDLDYVPHVARRADVRVAISNSFGLGGQNASIILARYEPGA